MIKKILVVFIMFILIVGMYGNVKAVETEKVLDVVEESSETKYLKNDQGYLSKKIISRNGSNGEVTIELKLANTKPKTTTVESEKAEVVFVIDNSLSMEEEVEEGKTRRDAVVSAAKEFISQLYDDIDNLKVGLLYYYAFDGSELEDGTVYEIYQDIGTMETAKVLAELTEDENVIQNALTTLSNMEYSYGTNTDAGLQKSKTMFSSDANTKKYVILLTDGIPNHAIGTSTIEPIQEEVNSKTKATIENINNSGIGLITILTGLTEVVEDDKAIIDTVFGTIENPTAGLLYSISDADISTIIEEEIYADLLETFNNSISSVKITDYFPNDIITHFDYELISATKGTASSSISKDSKSITWNIDLLDGSETASLKYKLKMKNMNNMELLNYVMKTNEKVELSYKDSSLQSYTETITTSPSVQLEEVIGTGKNEENENKEETKITSSITKKDDKTVIATIQSNKELERLDGWELSEDKKTLTKEYKTNTKETVEVKTVEGETKKITINTSNANEESEKTQITSNITKKDENTVVVTIKSNKELQELEGWKLSEDKKTLTKEYNINITETIKIETVDGETKEIMVDINSLEGAKEDSNEDNKKPEDKYEGKLPAAGESITALILLTVIAIVSIISYKKCRDYKF